MQNKNAIVGHSGRDLGKVTYFCSLCTPSLPTERLNIQTSNFAPKLITMCTIYQKQN